MVTPIRIQTYQHVTRPAYWAGRAAFLEEGTTREGNPFTDPADQLAWFCGWDDECEYAGSFLCEHVWTADEAGEYCLACNARKQ